LARSSPRRSLTPTRADVSGARTAPDAFLAPPRIASGAECGPLDDRAAGLALFAFAAAAAPVLETIDCALGAWVSTPARRLVGAVLVERAGPAALLHGPVVIVDRPLPGVDPPPPEAPGGPSAPRGTGRRDTSPESPEIAIAADLVATTLETVARLGAETVFTRPQGLERIWVRFGFIPVPEGALPGPLRGRPGAGLFAYRGGSALWSIREAGPA
jgi:hypothetical protein